MKYEPHTSKPEKSYILLPAAANGACYVFSTLERTCAGL